MIKDLHHVQLAMPEGRESEARDFYCGVLGFVEVAKPEELRGRGGVWFRIGAVELHLGVDPAFVPARKAHPGLRVGSLQAMEAHLQAVGVPYRRDADLADWRRVYVEDPFGNRIELLEVSS